MLLFNALFVLFQRAMQRLILRFFDLDIRFGEGDFFADTLRSEEVAITLFALRFDEIFHLYQPLGNQGFEDVVDLADAVAHFIGEALLGAVRFDVLEYM